MCWVLRIALCFLVLSVTASSRRVQRQVNFGRKPARVSEQAGPNRVSEPIQFSVTKKEKNTILLKNILKKQSPVINTRFNFGQSLSKTNQECQTPLGEPGSCQYITARQCGPILSAILRDGISSRLLKYLISAIQSPCGFEGHDLTLCCAETKKVTETTTTTTTTTTTITTTASTTTITSTTTVSSTTIQISPETSTTTTTATTTTTTTPTPNQDCGIAGVVTRIVNGNVRIVGGEYAQQGAWPWAVIIGRAGLTGFSVICGGSLVDADTILTAAHCFDRVPGLGGPTTVRLGEHDITTTLDGAQHVDVAIEKIIQHPGWNPDTLDNDIAVVKLNKNLSLTPDIQTVCLPDQYVGKELEVVINTPEPVVVGWGATYTYGGAETKLRQTTVSVVTKEDCRAAYDGVNVDIGDTKVCAGKGERDTCNGDSGGPLLADHLGDDHRWSIVGITSFGVDCGRPDFPGVYTRVDKYLEWIRDKM